MKLIVGLGNPGKEFAKTRHNTGHLFASAFSKQLTPVPEQSSVRGAAANSKAVRSKPKTVCRRTTVFMNDSGKEVKKLTTDYQLLPTDLLVVHDDMDLPLGEFKLQFGRSAAGHKGVQSIIDALGTKDFWRLRIGIGKSPEGMEGEKYVLQPFSKKELAKVEEIFPKLEEVVGGWARGTRPVLSGLSTPGVGKER